MNIDLHNRIEKAAKQYATKVVPECISFYDEYFNDTVSDFRNGAEYGYKEAIKVAKDWLLNNASNYESSITCAAFHQQLAEAFETDMNKLFEETK